MRRCRKSRPPSGRIVVLRGSSEVTPMMAISAAPPRHPPPYDGGGSWIGRMKSGASSQHRGEAGHRLTGGLLVVHQGDADVSLGRVGAVGLAADIAAGQHFEV